MAQQDNIFLVIYSPERVILEKMVCKVSLPGSKGRFMVLKDHAPLISSLDQGRILFTADGVDIMAGFVEIAHNKVTVCAEL